MYQTLYELIFTKNLELNILNNVKNWNDKLFIRWNNEILYQFFWLWWLNIDQNYGWFKLIGFINSWKSSNK